jgi:type IV pilus assembly protein PilE
MHLHPHLSVANSRPTRETGRGFTLIEAMITVAIIGILATVALPSFNDYLLRGRLVDAINLLSAGRADMERFFQDNRTYAVLGSTTGEFTTVDAPPCGTLSTSRQGDFTLTCTAGGLPFGSSYTLTATGSNTTAGFAYTVTHANARTTTITSGPAGWTTPSPNTCWMVKKGQAC